jgi:hypothetical protein
MKHCANEDCPDLERYGQPGEYLDRIDVCPRCGRNLVPGEAPRAVAEDAWVDQVCLATFRHSAEAHVWRAKLLANGIPAAVLDQYLVGTQWLYSQAIGGVKLCVPREHSEAAMALLDADESEALRSAPEASLPPAPDELCPRCGAPVAGSSRLGVRSRALSLLLTIPFILRRRSERCSACGHRGRRYAPA